MYRGTTNLCFVTIRRPFKMMECFLTLEVSFWLGHQVSSLSSIIKHLCGHAPKRHIVSFYWLLVLVLKQRANQRVSKSRTNREWCVNFELVTIDQRQIISDILILIGYIHITSSMNLGCHAFYLWIHQTRVVDLGMRHYSTGWLRVGPICAPLKPI